MAFDDDKAKRKLDQKDSYHKHKISKASLIQEMRNEALELPEERYMGNNPKTATSKYIDKIEEFEQSQFKRVSMSKKEIRKLKNQQQREIQDNFDRLDDDYAAIDTILKRAQGREQDDDLR